eukprot:TRINITY_DN1526_c0_g1_i2.p1 TRINITY_DN1526_c0_g1~~TRINITY_DN1526_c0_g1_i2.p1  ORF type:complete len:337 (+),score=101.73 TRINITY_DN1526_c0_g1_i2:1290-2300(+)
MATEVLKIRPSGADTQRVLVALRERTIRESQPYKELITSHAKLIESNDTLRRKQRELELDVNDLQQNLTNLTVDSPIRGKADSRKEASLQQRLMAVKEEMNQAISREKESLNKVVQSRDEVDRMKAEQDTREQELTRLRENKQDLQDKLRLREIEREEVSRINQTMNDEYQALQMTCTSLEDKLRQLQKDNQDLITRWMDVKSRDADRINTMNETENKMRSLAQENELLKSSLDRSQAVSRSNGSNEYKPQNFLENIKVRAFSISSKSMTPVTQLEMPLCQAAFVPVKPSYKWDAHDGCVTAIQFSPTGHLMATGGDDKHVKLWDVAEGRAQLRYV